MDPRDLSQEPEADLVRRAQANDEAAFAELMRRNLPASMRLALSVLKDRQEAEDQVQNSFLNAWRRLEGFQFESRFSTWFRTIVLNQSLMRLRVRRRATLESLEASPDADRPREFPSREETPEANLANREMSERLRTEVKRLPPILRDVLVLRDLEQLSTEDAAWRLGISESAVKSRLTRARQLLRERMERYAGRTSLFVG